MEEIKRYLRKSYKKIFAYNASEWKTLYTVHSLFMAKFKKEVKAYIVNVDLVPLVESLPKFVGTDKIKGRSIKYIGEYDSIPVYSAFKKDLPSGHMLIAFKNDDVHKVIIKGIDTII